MGEEGAAGQGNLGRTFLVIEMLLSLAGPLSKISAHYQLQLALPINSEK